MRVAETRAVEGDRRASLRSCLTLAVLLAMSLLPARAQAAASAQLARIKDVASIEGIRDNQLVGYGLVVGLSGTGDSSQTVFPAQTLISTLERMGISVPQTGIYSVATMQVREYGGGLRGGHAAALQSARLQDRRHGLFGRRRPLAGGRGSADDPALRSGRADLRPGAGRAGAGRLYGYGRRQYEDVEPSDHGAGSRRSAGGAQGAIRAEADARGQRSVEQCGLPYRRADGGSIDKNLGGKRAHAVDSRRVEVAPSPARTMRSCWTRWRASRWRFIRGRGWWSMSAPGRW